MPNEGRDRDLVLAPGEYAYILDTTKGLVNTIVGPNKVSMSNTDQPVIWDKEKRKFGRVDAEKAICTDSIAPEGFYIALYNPSDKPPSAGMNAAAPQLRIGHRVNIPGPVNFALWPGQMADVIRGHHLRSNQYLLAQVYNDIEASANWSAAVVKPQAPVLQTGGGPAGNEPATPLPITPRSFTPGQLLIIKGTDVAFFIPPTGVKVVPESDEMIGMTFVREAVTLERLEYCILLDEDGNKRFVQGPAVVFPEPTETFIESRTEPGQRKFRAIELNETTGIYVKVIADYKEGDKEYKAGDELFITGKEQAIYFQREEHSVIRYGDQTKHYAVAIPSGEGRYVLNRVSGVVELVRGPKMLLCDPRYEVILRRVLAENTVKLWYPNNPRVIEINNLLANAAAAVADVAAYEPGRVTPTSSFQGAGGSLSASGGSGGGASGGGSGASGGGPSASYMMSSTIGGSRTMAMLNASDEAALKSSRQIHGDSFTRGQTFTPPRTITLDTKYEGAVSINVWTGYAVLIVNKTGGRRVVVGPQNILLEYDETLAPLELSTGKPKATTNLLRTVYLRVHNNKISDQIVVETKDLVQVNLSLSYRVNFEGNDHEKWFAVENYVKLLCDHLRSMIRNIVKRKGIEEFYGGAIDIIRDAVLGAAVEGKRVGRLFTENNMRVYDIEVIDAKITTADVATLLNNAQRTALKSAIQITEEERLLEVTKRSEALKQETATVKTATAMHVSTETQKELEALLAVSMARITSEANAEVERLRREEEKSNHMTLLTTEELNRTKQINEVEMARKEDEVALELKRIQGETEEIVKRTESIDTNLATALTTFADTALVEKMTIALAPMAAMSGTSVAEIMSQLFRGTPFEGVMKTLGTRSRMPIAATKEGE